MLPLTVPSGFVDTGLPDRGPEVVRPDETIEPSAAVDEKLNLRSTVSNAVAELLRGVKDSVGGFGPLKSVATSLCSVLDNCEVWPPSRTCDSQRLWLF